MNCRKIGKLLLVILFYPLMGNAQQDRLLNDAKITVQDGRPDSIIIQEKVLSYNRGFIEKDHSLILSAISDNLIMYNGNFSDQPEDWQVHMFLTGNELIQWVEFMLKEAGPFQNNTSITHFYLRRNAAIVVTEETGSNKFRKWKDDKVVYLLARKNDAWGITGFFIRNIANP